MTLRVEKKSVKSGSVWFSFVNRGIMKRGQVYLIVLTVEGWALFPFSISNVYLFSIDSIVYSILIPEIKLIFDLLDYIKHLLLFLKI